MISDESHLYAASVGDSKAVLFQVDRKQKNDYLWNNDMEVEDDVLSLYSHQVLTIDHLPNHQKENRRIIKSGGEVRPARKYFTKEYLLEHPVTSIL